MSSFFYVLLLKADHFGTFFCFVRKGNVLGPGIFLFSLPDITIFDLFSRNVDLVFRNFDLLTGNFDLFTPNFDLVSRNFD